jgi:hypothetical protein
MYGGALACYDGSIPCDILTTFRTSPKCIATYDEFDHVTYSGVCTGNIPNFSGKFSGLYTVYPIVTATYYFCSDQMFAFGLNTCPSVTINVHCPSGYIGSPPNCTLPVAPTPTTLTSFTATPASVSSGVGTTLAWAGTRGTNFNACMLIGGQWGGGTWVGGSLPNQTNTAPITANTTYGVQCHDTTYGWVGPLWKAVTVAALAPVTADATSNSPRTVGQSATISFYADSANAPIQCQINNSSDTIALKNTPGCPSAAAQTYTTPVYTAPGTYTYKFYYYRNGWTLVKSVAVTVTATAVPVGSCANGLNASYQPSCTCPAGQAQSGTVCAAAPVVTCANGLSNSYAPSCTCPMGQVQSGSLCVAAPVVTCANGLNNSYAPSCTCSASQVQSGAVCVPRGVIQSFTASPSRVLKGNTATVSWSTSNMSACALSSMTATGTAVLSALRSSTLTPTINSKAVFTLTCSDASGASYSASATVSLIPKTIER